MDFLPEDLQRYIESHTSEESDLLKKINRETHAHVLKSRMLVGSCTRQVSFIGQ